MEISPLEIYFIMQADAIQRSVNVIGGGLVLIAGVTCLVLFMCAVEEPGLTKHIPKSILAAFAGLMLLVVSAFIPTSSTLATMYLVPEVLNNEAITTEAKEIYDLMKEGLTDLVKNDE